MKKLLPLLLVILPSVAFSQQFSPPANPCTAAQQKEFDFWIGDWNLTWPSDKAGEIGHGTNNIRRILDGCAIEENFSGGDSLHLRGISVSTFDVKSDHWKQTWVDNEGGYLDFSGEFKDGQMILQRKAVHNGAKLLQRMVWKNITLNEFDWSWEASQDGGKTWQVNWPIHYKRRN